MGACASSTDDATRASRATDAKLADDAAREADIVKLLLLGAGESGKSTFFKKMMMLYGKGFSRKQLEEYRPFVYGNIVLSMKTLITSAELLGHEVLHDSAELFLELDEHDAVVDSAVADMVQALWADPGIQDTYADRAKIQLLDSTEYYFTNIRRIAEDGYCPTEEDVLRSRVKTTGIVEEHFMVEEVQFTIIDVGGQRNERKKWIHAFDGVTAIMFLTSLSGYDLLCYEDQVTNRIDESLELFEGVCKEPCFRNTPIILFLNKSDLFAQKIRKVDIRDELTEQFMDYTHGTCSCAPELADCACGVQKAAKNYLLQLFLARAGERKITHHFTCATNSDNIRYVFNACKDSILHEETVYLDFDD